MKNFKLYWCELNAKPYIVNIILKKSCAPKVPRTKPFMPQASNSRYLICFCFVIDDIT